ncbi:MAG: ABC transporter permease [Streptosporangiaceae bacterium]|nr:ABC transporter permease [Streptosporangiaceae bacterium]MBV9856069.1 ABC transporter permease [Streptosporangiaceae bacterium]
MNPTLYAVRLGLSRGWREFRQTLVSVSDVAWYVVMAVAFVLVLFFQRHSAVKGTHVSLAFAVLPGILGMLVTLGGIQGAASALAVEREDGTLLRAKAIPNGIAGYLTGRIVSVSLGTVLSLVIVLVPGLFLIPGLPDTPLTGWLTLVWVLPLGMLATLPWGAMIGSLANGQQSVVALSMLPFVGVTAISGIFYPISALAGWLQGIAQVFPVYWLGLGMRSAFLPASAAAAEIGRSWRYPELIAVLGAWAVAGLTIAPIVLRRMARKESGSSMQARRQRALQRLG